MGGKSARSDGKTKIAGRGKYHDRALRTAFVRAFVAGPVGVRGNVTRSIQHAGIASTEKSARTVGARLMREPAMMAVIERKLARADASNDRIIEELARIAFSDIREVVEWNDLEGVKFRDSSEIDDETAAAIAEVSQRSGKQGLERKVKMHGKVEALALLAKIHSLIRPAPRVEVTGDNVRIEFYLPDNQRAVTDDVIDAQAIPPELTALASNSA